MNSQPNLPISLPCHAIPQPSCRRESDLSEESLIVRTYNHEFSNYDPDFHSYLQVNGNCSGECRQALENTRIVASFVQEYLVDLISSPDLRCQSHININHYYYELERETRRIGSPVFGKSKVNACWSKANNRRAFFGRTYGQNSGSYASSLTVVAHEFGHMLNEKIINLRYQDESGALDESYADIFAILVANRNQSDNCNRQEDWNWNIGGEAETSIGTVRNLQNPSLYGQPEHWDNWVNTKRDHGGVHDNSGIHNKAIYELLISLDHNGNYLIDIGSATELFYGALLLLLKCKSREGFYEPTFLDSRHAMDSHAKTQFESDPERMQQVREAITSAFDTVGV